MQTIGKTSLGLLSRALGLCFLIAPAVSGQTEVKSETPSAIETERASAPVVSSASPKERASDSERITALEETLRQQATQLGELRKLLVEQQEMIKLLAGKFTGAPDSAVAERSVAVRANSETVGAQVKPSPQTSPSEDRLKGLEARVANIGPVKFSGDIRLRSETFFGLSNILPNGDNPAILGNELSLRQRMRVRARLSIRGTIGEEFDWGLRIASGSFADDISTNQTLTDFFNRKPFALDQAFVTYRPRQAPGLRLQGGKFEPPWTFTEMTIDSDLMVEGFNESYTRSFKKSAIKDLTLVAWQLPFLERNSAFVRNSNGTVNVAESRRGGRDLALYGGQLRARVETSAKVALNLSVSDLFFSGTQFISPVQVFGNQLQLPLTFTIPATATTPAQIVTTQVLIPRELLVAGHGNLGLSTANNNATNRDGSLSSGFNLVDLLGRLELKHNERFPVTVVLNFVTNTQTHDVVSVGPGGVNRVLPNHENNGFWGEVQVGQTKARGDMLLGYTFMRIEKDAVLTPFNMSDITSQSDMRGHRLIFSYAADPRVTFSIIGIRTERPNGLLGPFLTTPPGSLNRATTRLQFDTMIRF